MSWGWDGGVFGESIDTTDLVLENVEIIAPRDFSEKTGYWDSGGTAVIKATRIDGLSVRNLSTVGFSKNPTFARNIKIINASWGAEARVNVSLTGFRKNIKVICFDKQGNSLINTVSGDSGLLENLSIDYLYVSQASSGTPNSQSLPGFPVSYPIPNNKVVYNKLPVVWSFIEYSILKQSVTISEINTQIAVAIGETLNLRYFNLVVDKNATLAIDCVQESNTIIIKSDALNASPKFRQTETTGTISILNGSVMGLNSTCLPMSTVKPILSCPLLTLSLVPTPTSTIEVMTYLLTPPA